MSKKLVIFGFGGHARSVADVALACGYKALVFVDENAREGEEFLGFRAVPLRSFQPEHDWVAFVAVGDGVRRKQQCQMVAQTGLPLATLVSPSATIGPGSTLASGCFVGHHAHVGPMANVGLACIVNTGAIVEHESKIGDYSHVSVNATVAGRCSIGAFSMIGAAACVIDGISVGDHVVVGAGAVVCRSVSQAGTYIGVPAKRKQ